MSYGVALKKTSGNPPSDKDQDEYRKLMCSVPGCPNRWSVQIEKPMCSRHQWGDNPFTEKRKATKPSTDLRELLKLPPKPNFNDVDNELGF
jgi:hypothetical protein